MLRLQKNVTFQNISHCKVFLHRHPHAEKGAWLFLPQKACACRNAALPQPFPVPADLAAPVPLTMRNY